MENKQQQQLPSIKLINTHENHNENNKPKQAKNYLNEITKFNLKLHRQKEEQNKANTFFQKQVKNLTNNLNLVVKNNKDENADINRYSSRVDYPDYSDNSNNNKNINDNEGSLVENDFKKEVILSKVHFKEQATNSYSNNNSKNYNNNVIAHNNQVSSVQSVQSGNSNNEMVKHVPTFMNNNSNNNTLNRLSNNNSNTNEDITSKSNIKDLKNNANQFNNNHLNKSISTFNKTTSKSVAYKDLINKELNQDLENNNNTYKTINNVTNPMNTNKKIINKHVNLNENKNHYILREVAQDMNYVANTKNNRHIHNSIDLKFKNSPRIHEKDSDTGRNLFKILAEKKSDL